MKKWLATLSMAAAVALPGASALAADHRDGTAIQATADIPTDINDVYSWMSSDGSKVYLAMTVFPAATTASKFSDQAVYVLHTTSRMTFGSTQLTPLDIPCVFDTSSPQRVTCWIPNGATPIVVGGDASGSAGLSDSTNKVKVYAGLRKDHFFFNLDGFNRARGLVKTNAASLTFDNTTKCLTGPSASVTAVAGALSRDMNGNLPAVDFFKNLNTLAIVLELDKTLLNKGGDFLTVWGSTRRK